MQIPQMTEKDVARFQSKLVRVDKCLEFTGARTAKGYGHFGVGGRAGGVYLAHRIAWTVANGQIPDGLCVLHFCDNPPCCDDTHLWLGTKADNNEDMKAKGRRVLSPNASLTVEQVVEIKRRLAKRNEMVRLLKGFSLGQIAADFNVSAPAISDINIGKTWVDV